MRLPGSIHLHSSKTENRPDILLKFHARVLDEPADTATETLSAQLSGGFSAKTAIYW